MAIPPILPASPIVTLPRIPLPPEPSIPKEAKLAIVVAGVNYPRVKQGNIRPRQGKPRSQKSQWHRTYFHIANRYIQEWAFKSGGLNRAILFDFLEGEILEFVKGSSSEKTGTWLAPLRFPLEDANYRFRDTSGGVDVLRANPGKNPMAYWTGLSRYAASKSLDMAKDDIPIADYLADWRRWAEEENSLSIRDVYLMLHRCPARTLHELHFFGHSISQGPIIVNTVRLSPQSKLFDKDCRVDDFSSSIAKSVGFREAFARDAIIGIWGCDSDDRWKAAVLGPAMKEKPLGVPRRDAIELALSTTYARAFATHVGRAAHAPLPGSSGAHDGQDPDDGAKGLSLSPQLMHVHFGLCEAILAFYRDVIGISFPKTGLYRGHASLGRGYGRYPPP